MPANQGGVDLNYPAGMAVKETSSQASVATTTASSAQLPTAVVAASTVIFNGISDSTTTSIWTILPTNTLNSQPTVVLQIQVPDTTLTITANTVTVTTEPVSITAQPNTQIAATISSTSLSELTSILTAPPSITTSVQTVTQTTTQSASVATVTQMVTEVSTYSPSVQTVAAANAATSLTVGTSTSIATVFVTVTPPPAVLTTFSNFWATVYDYYTITSTRPIEVMSPPPEVPTPTPSAVEQTTEEVQPTTEEVQQPPAEETQQQQEEAVDTHTKVCRWKTYGRNVIYKCGYPEEFSDWSNW
ncbi:hypothetical protein LPJ73_006424 [Coemansia sp. RSA 2703]|nr:hypothetical protein LPJ73_006424 [Coemansia sp. RSA 2703]